MFVYADNAATTKMSKTAIDAMLPYLDTWYGNASSLYAFGQKSAEALAAARETVAGCLGAAARVGLDGADGRPLVLFEP